jgi:hypothetical protein
LKVKVSEFMRRIFYITELLLCIKFLTLFIYIYIYYITCGLQQTDAARNETGLKTYCPDLPYKIVLKYGLKTQKDMITPYAFTL